MLRSEYKALETKDRFNLLRKKFRAEIKKLVTDIKNNESYLYLEYDYFENRTDEELEKYVLSQVDSFITADPDPRFKHEDLGALGWKILKYDGFIACWQEAAAYGYEADFDRLPESKENQKEYRLKESLNPAQKELLGIIKDNLEDYGIDDPADIVDLIYYEWDNSNILIPTSFAKKYGEDPENISQELVDRYFDERINTPEFVERVRKLFNF